MSQNYEAMSLTEIKSLAKERNVSYASTMRKGEIIELLVKADEAENAQKAAREDRLIRERKDKLTVDEVAQLDSGEVAHGILEVMPDGYGFIRCENYMPGENDVYVSPAQIRKLNLKSGDIVEGNIRIRTQNEKFAALL